MDLDLNKLQFLSFFAICRESLRIVFSWRIYGVCKPSLASVYGLSMAIFGFSMLMSSFRLTYEYQKNSMDFSAIILSHLKSTWVVYLQLIVLLPYICLKSISSVVYSVAWIFSGKEEILSQDSIKKIIQSVSRRVLTTFSWSVAITGSYAIFGGFLAFFCVFFDYFRLVEAVIWIFYLMGFVYVSSVSHLALVIAILEDAHGLEAFVRSKSLIRGKLGLASAIFLLGFSSAAIIIFLTAALSYIVLTSDLLYWPVACAALVMIIALGPIMSAMAILFLLVAETIVYFVCKSYQDDDIEKSALADHLTSFFNKEYASIPATANEGEAESAEKPSIFSWQNPWIKVLFVAVGTAFTMAVVLFMSHSRITKQTD